jgi:hypothetical protein
VFDYSGDAALHNAIVLEQFGFNLESAIQAQNTSQIYYGSEFKKPDLLAEIFANHPLWDYVKEILTSGATFPLKEIPNEIRQQDIEFHIERGNHKSTLKYQEAVTKIIKEDVERGFALILPLLVIQHIKQASIAPLGCQKQWSINNTGE